MGNKPKHLDIKIYGEVQGVFFRHSAKMEAERLCLTGFAKNEPDGTVYIEVEGEEPELSEFLKWCEKGPDTAKVKKVEHESGDPRGFHYFTIKD